MKRYFKPAMDIVEIEGGAVLYDEFMSIDNNTTTGGGNTKSTVFDLDGLDKDEPKGGSDNTVWE